MSEKFWGIQDQIPEPKRSFKFTMISNLGPHWVIQMVKNPAHEVSETIVPYAMHKFKYPGRTTWKDIEVTLIDALTPDAAATSMAMLGMSGYRYPTTVLEATHTMTKQNCVASLGNLTIQATGLDMNDVRAEWQLANAWVKSVDPGEFNYDSEEMMKLNVTIAYDWAIHSAIGGLSSVYNQAKTAANGNDDMAKGLAEITKTVGVGQG